MMNCPCGNKKPYTECCEVAHQSLKDVKTAEQLMRSRYTAFTIADGDYLMESHHVSTRPLSKKEEIVTWTKSVAWVELKILSTTKGLKNDTEGTVAFEACFKENGRLSCIKEHSKFVKEGGCWYYLGIV